MMCLRMTLVFLQIEKKLDAGESIDDLVPK